MLPALASRALSVTEQSEEQRIWITFWSLGPHGAREHARQIDVPTWHEVAENYPAARRRQLARLMGEEFEPAVGGRLLLWHGAPGHRQDLRAARARVGVALLVRLPLRHRPGDVLRLEPDLHARRAPERDDEDGDRERWRLLILEDTGELLAADAKERTGQGLSRLLNVVDGLIGQGLRVLVLVTTNETLRSLHPAVSRPGRCASQIEFAAFSAEEAAEWLARHGADASGQVATLATLFARRVRLRAGRAAQDRFVQ